MKTFTNLQFSILLAVNVILIGIIWGHYLNEQVKVETQYQDKIIYKDRIVKVDDASKRVIDEMQAAGDLCDRHSQPVKNFHIDNQDKPVFTCE